MKFLALALTILMFASTAQADETPRYPKESRTAFLESCVGLTRELIPYCVCMLKSLEKRIPYEEFVTMVQSKEDLAKDPRVTTYATYCLETVKPRD